MPSLNEITVLGHTGRDAESGSWDSGDDYCKFSVATQNFRIGADGKPTNKNPDGSYVDSTWHNVIVTGWQVRYAAEIQKGDLVQVKGKLKIRDYTSRDGTPKRAVEIVAKEVLRIVPFPKRDGTGYQPKQDDYQNDAQRAMTPDDFEVGELGPPLDMDDGLSPGD